MAYQFLYYRPFFYLTHNDNLSSPTAIGSYYSPAICCTTEAHFNTLYSAFSSISGLPRTVLSRIESVTGLRFNTCLLPCTTVTTAQYTDLVSVGEFAVFNAQVTLDNYVTDQYTIFASNGASISSYWVPTISKSKNVDIFQPSGGEAYTFRTDTYYTNGMWFAHGTNNSPTSGEARLLLNLPVLLKPADTITKTFNYSIVLIKDSTSSTISRTSQYNTSAVTTIYNSIPLYDADDPSDPYDPSGPSEPDYPDDGTFDNTSDPYTLSSLPSISIADTGFTRIYTPSLEQVRQLARYMWTDGSIPTTFINHIRQYFENPMDAFIGFNILPVTVPFSRTENFSIMLLNTGVYMNVANSQFVRVDCGTVHVDRQYGSAIDYSPYTKISAFLPYIGMVDLDTDEVMNKTLRLIYNIDIVTGSCVAHILVSGADLYQFNGNCAVNIPFSQADFSNYVSSLISIAKLGVSVATESSYAAIPSITTRSYENATVNNGDFQNENDITTTYFNDTGFNESQRHVQNIGTTESSNKSSGTTRSTTTQNYRGLTPGQISNTVGQIMSSKPNIVHSGTLNGNAGNLGNRRPMIIKRYPRLCNPSEYGQLNGRPSLMYLSLGSCTGYTQVQQCQLKNISATANELDEIYSLLKGGVVFNY